MTDQKEPIEIELDPRDHSRLYNLKPESCWLVFFSIMFVLLGAYVNGFTNPVTWSLVIFSVMFGCSLIVVFPYIALKKMDD